MPWADSLCAVASPNPLDPPRMIAQSVLGNRIVIGRLKEASEMPRSLPRFPRGPGIGRGTMPFRYSQGFPLLCIEQQHLHELLLVGESTSRRRRRELVKQLNIRPPPGGEFARLGTVRQVNRRSRALDSFVVFRWEISVAFHAARRLVTREVRSLADSGVSVARSRSSQNDTAIT